MKGKYEDIHRFVVERAQKGDPKAQKELYKLYANAMYTICRRMMGNEEQAKDVHQDAFVEVFKKLHTFQYRSTFGAWVKRIIINHCINALKKNKLLLVPIK